MSVSGVPEEYVRAFFEATRTFSSQVMQSHTSGYNLARHGMPSVGLTDFQKRSVSDLASLAGAAWQGECGTVKEPTEQSGRSDKRFASQEWQEQPGFHFLSQFYLIAARFVTDSVNEADVDKRTRDRLSFFARQFVQATCPTNFLLTNPEAIKLASETNGLSLLRGLQNFLEDLNKGHITQTDETVFVVGRNLATSAGEVIFENEVMQLIQYAPRTQTVRQRPVVMIPPCINKFYILDMQAESSLVGHAIDAGHTVFMVSWRNVGREHGYLTWDDYLTEGVMRAVDVACEIAGSAQVDALGFCVGGTMLACAVAVMRARGDNKVATLSLLATMLDFSDTGEMGLMIDEASCAGREQTIGAGGILPAQELAFMFSALRANDLIWHYAVNNYLKGQQPPAFDLLYWNSDGTNVSGPWYTWYTRNAYLENNIRVPQRTLQCGVPVDLRQIDMPVYLLATREDHIVPWQTAYSTTALLSGPVEFTLGASGHVAGIVNPPRKNKRSYWAGGNVSTSPEEWLASAIEHPGSWWTTWTEFLARHPSNQVAARDRLGNDTFAPIEPAPGSYVMEKADE